MSKFLIATLGFPGSGKTYFSKQFTKDMGFFHLNSDRLRSEMFPQPKFDAQENAAVFRTMDYITEELLRSNVSLVYDANSTKRTFRKRLQQIAKKQKAHYILLWFQTPVKTALKRVHARKGITSKTQKMYHKAMDDEVLFRIRAAEEPPIDEPHIILQTAPYEKQKLQLTRFLHSLK